MGAEISGSSMGASRGSRGSPEVGSRRVNDASISRIFFFFLGVPNRRGMPWCTMSACGDWEVRPAACWWLSFGCRAYMLQVPLEFFLNLHVVVWCESPRRVPEIQMGVYNLDDFMFLAVTRGPSLVYFDVLWRQVVSHLLKWQRISRRTAVFPV